VTSVGQKAQTKTTELNVTGLTGKELEDGDHFSSNCTFYCAWFQSRSSSVSDTDSNLEPGLRLWLCSSASSADPDLRSAYSQGPGL